MHHVLTIFTVLLAITQPDLNAFNIFTRIMLMFETGNLPIYAVCSMKKSIHRLYWHNSYILLYTMFIEFIMFVIYRCILPWLYFMELNNYHKIIFLGIHAGKYKMGIWVIS